MQRRGTIIRTEALFTAISFSPARIAVTPPSVDITESIARTLVWTLAMLAVRNSKTRVTETLAFQHWIPLEVTICIGAKHVRIHADSVIRAVLLTLNLLRASGIAAPAVDTLTISILVNAVARALNIDLAVVAHPVVLTKALIVDTDTIVGAVVCTEPVAAADARESLVALTETRRETLAMS